jgi:hypothetical protein
LPKIANGRNLATTYGQRNKVANGRRPTRPKGQVLAMSYICWPRETAKGSRVRLYHDYKRKKARRDP